MKKKGEGYDGKRAVPDADRADVLYPARSYRRVLWGGGPGTLYAMLSKFEENGVIRKTSEEGRRKSYIITDRGNEMLWDEYERLRTMVSDGAGRIKMQGSGQPDGFLELSFAFLELSFAK